MRRKSSFLGFKPDIRSIDHWQRQQFFNRRSFIWVDFEHAFDKLVQLSRVLLRYSFVCPITDYSEKFVHVFGLERQVETTHLVADATDRPDIGLESIWLVFPNLRGCVVRGPSLCVVESVFLGEL